MNKQEAIKQLEWNVVRTSDFDRAEDVVVFEKVKSVISQIHEPQKVVVPKFIADYVKECRGGARTLTQALFCLEYHKQEIGEWLNRNEETFARAWLDGYEVEKEKLYEVTVPHTSNYKNQTQHLVKQGENWFFCGNDVNRFKYRFTKGQIEAAGFGWVFDCKGVKVEEVEEN